MKNGERQLTEKEKKAQEAAHWVTEMTRDMNAIIARYGTHLSGNTIGFMLMSYGLQVGMQAPEPRALVQMIANACIGATKRYDAERHKGIEVVPASAITHIKPK